jgi:hypothetical protein
MARKVAAALSGWDAMATDMAIGTSTRARATATVVLAIGRMAGMKAREQRWVCV